MKTTKIHRKYERLYEEHLHGLAIHVPSEVEPRTLIPLAFPEVASFWFDRDPAPSFNEIEKIHQVNIDHTEYGVRHFSPLGKALNGR